MVFWNTPRWLAWLPRLLNTRAARIAKWVLVWAGVILLGFLFGLH